jgi:hypothetical protein
VQLIQAKGVNFSVKIEGPYGELPGAVLNNTTHHDTRELLPSGDSSKSAKEAAAAGHHGSPAGMDGLVIAAGASWMELRVG